MSVPLNEFLFIWVFHDECCYEFSYSMMSVPIIIWEFLWMSSFFNMRVPFDERQAHRLGHFLRGQGSNQSDLGNYLDDFTSDRVRISRLFHPWLLHLFLFFNMRVPLNEFLFNMSVPIPWWVLLWIPFNMSCPIRWWVSSKDFIASRWVITRWPLVKTPYSKLLKGTNAGIWIVLFHFDECSFSWESLVGLQDWGLDHPGIETWNGTVVFIEKQRVTWEGKEPMRERPHGGLGGEEVMRMIPREGCSREGNGWGAPSPSLDGPWCIARIGVYRSSEAPGRHS